MGKCYCDYCDVFLTNDSVAVRKQHNEGNRHKYNVCEYYRQYMGQKLQEQIDDIVAAFQVKVARGIVRPSYGLPTPVKPHPPKDPKDSPRHSSAIDTNPTMASDSVPTASDLVPTAPDAVPTASDLKPSAVSQPAPIAPVTAFFVERSAQPDDDKGQTKLAILSDSKPSTPNQDTTPASVLVTEAP